MNPHLNTTSMTKQMRERCTVSRSVQYGSQKWIIKQRSKRRMPMPFNKPSLMLSWVRVVFVFTIPNHLQTYRGHSARQGRVESLGKISSSFIWHPQAMSRFTSVDGELFSSGCYVCTLASTRHIIASQDGCLHRSFSPIWVGGNDE